MRALKWRFSLRALLLVTTLVAVGLVAGRDAYYWTYHRPEMIHLAMHRRIAPGDSLGWVTLNLGPGRLLHPEEIALVRQAVIRSDQPDGLQPFDSFVRYPMGDRTGLILQFRNGRLVNHNPADFRFFEPFQGLAELP